MNYKNIKLENERSTHLTKRLNRLSSWGFFKVLYGNSSMKMLLTNLLMLVTCAPIILFVVLGTLETNTLLSQVAYYNSFGSAGGVWTDVVGYYRAGVAGIGHATTWKACLSGVLTALMFSGGFAIIRDSFWTGKLTVFRCFADGVKANIGYAAASAFVLSACVYGLIEFFVFAKGVLALWLAIVLLVLLCIVAMFIAIYCLILCSITVTYKQSVAQNLKDSWLMLWLNIWPHILHFIVMFLPIAVYLIFGQTLQIVVLLFMLMVGFFYFPFVWQTHMMKIFALFHPVVVNKKGEPKQTAANGATPAQNTAG